MRESLNSGLLTQMKFEGRNWVSPPKVATIFRKPDDVESNSGRSDAVNLCTQAQGPSKSIEMVPAGQGNLLELMTVR